MRIDTSPTRDGSGGLVVAHGEVDLATVSRLRDAVSDHLSQGRTRLLLDLSAVTFIDSTGLGVIVGAAKKAYGLGGSLELVCDNPRILRLLTITGLARSFPVHATLADAGADAEVAPAAST